MANEISFKCDCCDEVLTVEYEELDVQQVGSDERQMGVEITYAGEAEIECSQCEHPNTVKYECTEYPIGSPNFDETVINGEKVSPGFGSCV